jgi:phage terminase large subunit-like protein
MVRDKLGLTERTDLLFQFHQQYLPLGVGYEQYGMQSDRAHIDFVQDLRNYHFVVTPLGGKMAKNDRIRQLIPFYESKRFWFPPQYYRRNWQGKKENLIKKFLDNELGPFPVMDHDDMLDSQARILDPDLAAQFPTVKKRPQKESWRDKLKNRFNAYGGNNLVRPSGSMSA